MLCAKDIVLSVLSGLCPVLSDEEVKEEMMRCFSPIPTRRQAVEMMRTMCQEVDEQMSQYISRHVVACTRAHWLLPDDQLSLSEIIEFAMTIKDKTELFVQNIKMDQSQPNGMPHFRHITSMVKVYWKC